MDFLSHLQSEEFQPIVHRAYPLIALRELLSRTRSLHELIAVKLQDPTVLQKVAELESMMRDDVAEFREVAQY